MSYNDDIEAMIGSGSFRRVDLIKMRFVGKPGNAGPVHFGAARMPLFVRLLLERLGSTSRQNLDTYVAAVEQSWASVCAGSGIDAYGIHAVSECLGVRMPEVMCSEIIGYKRRFRELLLSSIGHESDCPIFGDVKALAEHGRGMEISSPFIRVDYHTPQLSTGSP